LDEQNPIQHPIPNSSQKLSRGVNSVDDERVNGDTYAGGSAEGIGPIDVYGRMVVRHKNTTYISATFAGTGEVDMIYRMENECTKQSSKDQGPRSKDGGLREPAVRLKI
jgi:hypothetical protein